MPSLALPAADLDLERFERVMAGDRLALLRVGARWPLEPDVPPPAPTLVAEGAGPARRFAALPQASEGVAWVHADARLWWAGFAVPADLVLASGTRWSLEAPRGVGVALPEPEERALLDLAEPAGVVVRNGRPYLLLVCGLVAAALVPLGAPSAARAAATGGSSTGSGDGRADRRGGAPTTVSAVATQPSASTETAAATAPSADAPATGPTPTTSTPTTTAPTPTPPAATHPAPASPPPPPGERHPAPRPHHHAPAHPHRAPHHHPSAHAHHPRHHHALAQLHGHARPRHPVAHLHHARHVHTWAAPRRHAGGAVLHHVGAHHQAVAVPRAGAPAPAGLGPLAPAPGVPAPGAGLPGALLAGFQVPPFLLAIYQAAGIQYDVPWQVLAAINQIETDFGRNLNVSSAGALGWMQFMPDTWRLYGVDANLDGRKDPSNPADAIFAAARYLHAAGASHDLRGAIFAYNHAGWYVDQVMGKARQLRGLPPALVDALTGLTQARFPVPGPHVRWDAAPGGWGSLTGAVASGTTPRSATVRARPGHEVVAATDGRVVALGRRHGHAWLVLEDAFGNRYSYGHLGRLARTYPAARTQDAAPAAPPPTFGMGAFGVVGASVRPSAPAAVAAQGDLPAGKQRLYAHPAAAEAQQQDASVLPTPARERVAAHPAALRAQLADVAARRPLDRPKVTRAALERAARSIGLEPSEVVMRELRPGSRVLAGTVLGRLGSADRAHRTASLRFRVRPLGPSAPTIDPAPLLAAWQMQERSHPLAPTAASTRTSGHARHHRKHRRLSLGQTLLLDRGALARQVLADPRVHVYGCGREDIRAGRVDRRVLATLEYLAASRLHPTVTALACDYDGPRAHHEPSAHAAGAAVDIAEVNGVPLRDHQGRHSVGERTVRRLLHLQGSLRPRQVIARRAIRGLAGSVALPGHDGHIAVAYAPSPPHGHRLGRLVARALAGGSWTGLPAAPTLLAAGGGGGIGGIGGLDAPDPARAPALVRAVIDGADRISGLPYVWGGGHGNWSDVGYDCSGSVSFALHAAGLLNVPLTSGSLMSYGEAGPGRWITIYANPSHTFMRIAGRLYGTSGFAHLPTTGPDWFRMEPSPSYLGGFVTRHPAGL